ncbi:hypothetical protein N3K66_008010 [Trichothecium roseum]|uniref:Uncharacterized protein n=1 Tax=Trichothecium roseum TaxID=47278 RepID=A0ACC0US96_9HYPO|nr:hypothetical protein N3K66_008010 [Trichothecium roseum]
MPGPGGGPPRRSHTKSRKGCETCKRRHIRCDESFPQCRNCTKHKSRCPYNDMPSVDTNRSVTPEKPNLLWTAEKQLRITEWQMTGIFPFPSLEIYPGPNPNLYSFEELLLMYHVAEVYDQLYSMNANHFTLWTRYIPTLISIGSQTQYVMHALLSFSAMHIAFITECPKVARMSYDLRGHAYEGLKGDVSNFSRENSDAVLAASLVLSWEAHDWSSWTQLMQGTRAVMESMESWKRESMFADFIAESSTFPTAPASPGPKHQAAQPRKEDLDAHQQTVEQIQRVEAHLKQFNEDTVHIQSLANFLKGSRKISASIPIAQQFERLRSLRDWLFWMPVGYLQSHRCSPNSLLAVSHLYTVALLMERLFPEIGSAYFGSLCIQPVENIARHLMSYNITASDARFSTPLKLMEFPIDAVGEFRNRMGWNHPERTASFPSFDPPNFTMFAPSPQISHVDEAESFMPYGTPSFSYSSEDLHSTASVGASQSPIAPLSVPAYYDQSYLNIPSPLQGGYYSPASSTFEGSVTFSDADDFGSFDFNTLPSAHSPLFNDAHCFGTGFVSPTQPVYGH